MTSSAVSVHDHLDLSWFALDRTGAVAMFATGGAGAFPSVLDSYFDQLNNAEQQLLKALPICSEVAVDDTWKRFVTLRSDLRDAEARYLNSHLEFARRGVFTFDAILLGDAPAAYFRVGCPKSLIGLFDIPATFRELISLMTFSKRSFGETSFIDVGDIANP